MKYPTMIILMITVLWGLFGGYLAFNNPELYCKISSLDGVGTYPAMCVAILIKNNN